MKAALAVAVNAVTSTAIGIEPLCGVNRVYQGAGTNSRPVGYVSVT